MNKSADSITLADIAKVKKKITADWGVLRSTDVAAFMLGCIGFVTVLWSIFYENVFVALSGTAAILLAFALIPLYSLYSRHAKTEYEALFKLFDFVTPAGEEVKFVSSDQYGHFVTVRFDDGYELRYPLGTLTNKAGQAHEFELRHVSSVGYTRSLSKVKWRDTAGKVGIVRKVLFSDNSGIAIILKFDDGQIAEFPLRKLEPVPVAASDVGAPETPNK